jgi:hypothetical protein
MQLVEGGSAGITSKYSDEKHTSPVTAACILWLQVAACATTFNRCGIHWNGAFGCSGISASRESRHT